MQKLLCTSLLFVGLAHGQAVLPPFDTTYNLAIVGSIPGLSSYGGTAFHPTNPNVLLVSLYPSTNIYAVPLQRNLQGFITSLGTATSFATVGGTDGGLAVGPNNVLFATWYGPNRLSQVKQGSTSTDRVDDLTPLGVASSVGACTFVPAGLPGAGRFKVANWNSSQFYELPLTPDGNGTFAPGNATSSVQLSGGPEGLVYAPATSALIGGQLLVVEWNTGNIAAYQVDSIGNPLPATRQVVAGGLSGPGGGTVDPITGDILFLQSGGVLVALRNGAACGTFTGYGVATPGAGGTPTINANGCARIGQSITILTGGPANGLGLIALGNFATNVVWNGLTVLQPLQATVVDILSPLGTSSLVLPIPLNPLLGNSHVYLQSAYLDASTASGFIASAGLDVLIR